MNEPFQDLVASLVAGISETGQTETETGQSETGLGEGAQPDESVGEAVAKPGLLPLSPSLCRSRTLIHTHTHTHTLTHSLTHSHTHSHSLTHSLTDSHTHSLSLGQAWC